MPVRIVITSGTTADYSQAETLIKKLDAKHLLADRGYDSKTVVEKAEQQGMQVQISSRKNRKVARKYDRQLYRLCYLVENTFLHLKRWRGIATRYAKNNASFLAVVQIRCLVFWLKIS